MNPSNQSLLFLSETQNFILYAFYGELHGKFIGLQNNYSILSTSRLVQVYVLDMERLQHYYWPSYLYAVVATLIYSAILLSTFFIRKRERPEIFFVVSRKFRHTHNQRKKADSSSIMQLSFARKNVLNNLENLAQSVALDEMFQRKLIDWCRKCTPPTFTL